MIVRATPPTTYDTLNTMRQVTCLTDGSDGYYVYILQQHQHIYNMYTLYIQIQTLQAIDTQSPASEQLTIMFGSVQHEMYVEKGGAAERLMLQMEETEMEGLLSRYAFGLFIKHPLKRCFCLLSLRQLEIGEEYSQQQILFYNDQRIPLYQAKLSLTITHHHPQLPSRPNTRLPKQQPKTSQKEKKTFTFLNQKQGEKAQPKVNQKSGKKAPVQAPPRPTKVLSIPQPQPKQSKIPRKTEPIKSYETVQENDDDGVYFPPMMEFTNEQPEPEMPHYVPKVLPKTEQKQVSIQEKKPISPKHKTKQFSREQIRQMALIEAEKHKKQTEILLPVPKDNTYELKPITSFTSQEITKYAQTNQELQEMIEREKKLKKQLELEKKKNTENRLNQEKVIPRQKSNQGVKIAQQQQVKQKIEEVPEPERMEESIDEDYQSDFDSISLGNSLLKSRHSLRSSNYHNSSQKKVDESGSVLESGYSQDFDSYSQSMLSHHKKRANSISEISESMRSGSQFYRN